jgi:hypothetical protein
MDCAPNEILKLLERVNELQDDYDFTKAKIAMHAFINLRLTDKFGPLWGIKIGDNPWESHRVRKSHPAKVSYLKLKYYEYFRSQGLTEETIHFLSSVQEGEEFVDPISAYWKLFEVRRILHEVARQATELEWGEASAISPISARIRISVGKDKILTFHLPGILSLLTDHRISLGSIRVCKQCGKLFWPKQERSRVCSSKCSNAWTNAKYRTSNKERINEMRRMRYASKKEQKLGAQRKRGSSETSKG